MTKGMRCYPLFDLPFFYGSLENILDTSCGVLHWIFAGTSHSFKEPVMRSFLLKIDSKQVLLFFRYDGVAVFIALAIGNADLHPIRVYGFDRQIHEFTDLQPS